MPSGQPKFAALLLLSGVVFAICGCGVPGEPVPPSPPIPLAVGDLVATQIGDGVLLSFTLPTKSTRNLRLAATPTLEILRGALRPDGTPDAHSLHVADIVPAAMLASYIQAGKVQFLERFPADETRAHPGKVAVFVVRTRVSERKSSADSNFALVTLYPVPAPIDALQARVTEKSIDLSWTPPARTSAGEPLSTAVSFLIYRGEIDPASAAAAETDLHAAVWKAPLLQIANVKTPEYQDTGFDWGKTYAYVVRSVIQVNGAPLDSADSRPALVTPRDIFPPAAPQDLVAAVLPDAGSAAAAATVDLSWAINVETDLAGYRVYRSERENERGKLLNASLLPSPSYRDAAVQPARRYWYTVTAVDRAGNESDPSAALPVDIP